MLARFSSLAVLLCATLCPLLAAAGDSALVVSNATVRAVPPGTSTTAAFMTIANGGASDRKLVKADSPVANIVELHTHSNDNGVMKMRQVQDILIKANDQTLLKPGSYHIMLIDLKQTPKEGETVAVTLVFDDGTSTTVSAAVTRPQAAMPAGKDTGHGAMKH